MVPQALTVTKELQDEMELRVNQEYPVPEVMMDSQVPQDPKVPQERVDPMVMQVHQDLPDPQDHLVHQVHPAAEVTRTLVMVAMQDQLVDTGAAITVVSLVRPGQGQKTE